MSDGAGERSAAGRASRLFGALRPNVRDLALGDTGVWRIAGLVAALLAASFWSWEGWVSNVVFTAGTTLALAALVVVATRRILVATVAVASLILLINCLAAAKHATLGMVLHAYDIVFYLSSWSTVSYLWSGARSYVVLFALGLTIIASVCWLAWRIDRTRASRGMALATFAAATVVATGGAMVKPERRQTQFYWDALYVSSFYASWAETLETLWRGQLIESAEASTAPPFLIPRTCVPDKKPPHIVLIHEESIVQPGLFPGLGYDRALDGFFKSGDGATHKLRVETYGGASWLTEFSILTGLSTHSFGGMRPFVQSLLAGKVRNTLPEALAACGYRNVLFYPMLKNFVSNARFYDAIGLKEIFDLKDQRAPSVSERDRFYFDNAVAEMERHVKASSKPLFTYIQTMSAHWPYDHKYAPEMTVAGGAPGTDPEMSEYLRRVAIAKLDYEYLKSELARRFPGEPILIVHYGDHHPMATRKLLGFGDETQVEDMIFGPQSPAFTTYYAVEALNFDTPALPAIDVLDVPYIGAVMMQQARLPLPPPYKERLRLMQLCDGRYNDCAHKDQILAFHRRLIDSRLIDEQ